MFDKKYYEEKIQTKIGERGKAINRLIQDIYAFVKDNEEIVAEVNKINEIIKAEEIKESAKEKDESVKPAK